MGCFDAVFAGGGDVWSHLGHPGAPARLAGQEKDVFTSCPVHVADRTAVVLARVARSLQRFRQLHRSADTTSGPISESVDNAPKRLSIARLPADLTHGQRRW